MHSPEESNLRISTPRRRELSDRASRSHGSGHRRPLAPDLHVPNVDSRNASMRPPLLPQPVLLVPSRAALDHVDIGSDRGGPARPPHGLDDHAPSVLQGARVGVHAQSRPVQRERARADHDLRELRCWQRVRHPRR
jgi:hypothetical protein